MRYTPLLGLVMVASLSAACASAPPAVAPTVAPVMASDQKMSWILRLEDQRILRAPAPPPVAPPPPPPTQKKSKKPEPPPPPPVVTPDLTELVADPDPRIRRRAALAIGRVG